VKLLLLLAFAALPALCLDWNKEYKQGDVTVIATKVERPGVPAMDAMWEIPDGFFVSVKTDDPKTVEFEIYVYARLSDGRTFLRSARVQKRLDTEYTWAHFTPGRCAEIVSVAVEEIPPKKVAEF
jgi:hypothetical protein